MNVLVVTQYYYPEQFRVNDICEELSRRGHSVTVLTGLPNYPSGEIYTGYETKYLSEEFINGVTIIRCKIRPRHKGALNLLLNYFSFAISGTKKAKKLNGQYDVIYVYEVSPVTCAIPAIKLKKKLNIPIYFYCCDLWPESVRGEHNGHKQIGKKHPIYLVAKTISKCVYRNVDLIGCKCNEFVDYLYEECSVPRSKMTVLYEHAEETYLSISEVPFDNGTVDFMFLGNMGKVQNCDQIIDAASHLIPTRPFMVHFVGDGSEIEELKKKVEQLGLSHIVVFHGKYPVSEINQFYDYADVCLLTLSNRTATGLTPPAKLAGYMAAARTVIASINGAARTIIEDSNCGFAVPADDVNGLQKLMQKVVDGEIDTASLGMNGRKYFLEYFTLEKHVDSLEKQLNQLMEDFRR